MKKRILAILLALITVLSLFPSSSLAGFADGDENGEITLTGLTYDWYTISAILPPPGYLADTAPKGVKFAPGGTLQIKFDNTRKGLPSGFVMVVDEEGRSSPRSHCVCAVCRMRGSGVQLYACNSQSIVL
jgi:hypothetical protein